MHCPCRHQKGRRSAAQWQAAPSGKPVKLCRPPAPRPCSTRQSAHWQRSTRYIRSGRKKGDSSRRNPQRPGPPAPAGLQHARRRACAPCSAYVEAINSTSKSSCPITFFMISFRSCVDICSHNHHIAVCKHQHTVSLWRMSGILTNLQQYAKHAGEFQLHSAFLAVHFQYFLILRGFSQD